MKNDDFIAENLGLVHTCARRFADRGVEYDDLFQAGCMGLVKAAGRFEPERGLCFSTYAVPVILGEIRRLFRDGGTVKVSRGLKELAMKAQRLTAEYTARTGSAPHLGELAGLLQVSEEDAAMALSAGQPPLSLTETEGENERDLPVEDREEELTDRLSLEQAIRTLPQQDQKLIAARYFFHKTQTQAARELGLSQVQVSRREKKILLTLRSLLA